MINQQCRKPDIEFKRKIGVGCYVSYGHIYFNPFIVHLFGKTIIGKKHLQEKIDKSFKNVKINCPVHKDNTQAIVLKSGSIWCKKCYKLSHKYDR